MIFQYCPLCKQRGLALAETVLALLPVLLIGSLCLELARGYQVRHLLALALHETARVAAVHQGDPRHWQPTLQNALSRLFLPPGRFADAKLRLEHERLQFQQRYGRAMWHAERISTGLDATATATATAAAAVAAETIHLRLTYLYRPMQTWLSLTIGKVYSATAPWAGSTDRNRSAWRQGLVPIVIEVRTLRHRSTP